MKVLIKLMGLIGSCHKREPREKRTRQTPSKPGKEQLREERWSPVECCLKAAEDKSDDRPLNVVFEP